MSGYVGPDPGSDHAGHGHDHSGFDHDHDHDDDNLSPEQREAADAELADAIWQADNVELVTVGIDIGSATSHLMFSKLHMQRKATEFSSRFIVVERTALYRSSILLTPYRSDGLIDLGALRTFVDRAYADAEFTRSDIDAGAVILTGVALERSNARGIAEIFAEEGGKFVCASAGHNLEALLAAHGSGAVGLSIGRGPVLNLDIGGGTTKLALAQDGKVLGTMAISAGARLVEFDPSGVIIRIEHTATEVAAEIGLPLSLGATLDATARSRLADALATRVLRAAAGRPERHTVLAGELPASPVPTAVVFSGGVGELVVGGDLPPAGSFGDLGTELATALRARLGELPAPVSPSMERIRATVIGASQFSVQLSGNTVRVSDRSLPMHNIPVVSIPFDGSPDEKRVADAVTRGAARLDLAEREEPIAIAVAWDGDPHYASLRALAGGIAIVHKAAPRRNSPLIVALSGDIGRSIGTILTEELGVTSDVIAIDGLELSDLDYIDIGERLLPANVVPVVVKSLVFPDASGIQRPEILERSRR
jgi:ethanolamine utilization protein EutA